MSKHVDNVPGWVRAMVGIFGLYTIIVGIKCYLNPGMVYGNVTGIDMTNLLTKETAYEVAAMYLALGLAMAFVTIIKGAPEALTILTIIRALNEVQSIIAGITLRDIQVGMLKPVVLLLIEIWMIKTLVGVIKKEEAE